MRFFLIISIIITFIGCSNNNAFDRFNMSKERERSEENIQSTKLTDKELVIGIATAVHLNKAYPELYNNAEYFYIYLNIDGEPEDTVFELNGSNSMLIEELNSTNEFTQLTHFDANWKHYYLVGFQKEQGKLELLIKNREAKATFTFRNE